MPTSRANEESVRRTYRGAGPPAGDVPRAEWRTKAWCERFGKGSRAFSSDVWDTLPRRRSGLSGGSHGWSILRRGNPSVASKSRSQIDRVDNGSDNRPATRAGSSLRCALGALGATSAPAQCGFRGLASGTLRTPLRLWTCAWCGAVSHIRAPSGPGHGSRSTPCCLGRQETGRRESGRVLSELAIGATSGSGRRRGAGSQDGSGTPSSGARRAGRCSGRTTRADRCSRSSNGGAGCGGAPSRSPPGCAS